MRKYCFIFFFKNFIIENICRSCKSPWEDDTIQVCPCQQDNNRNNNQPFSVR